ncbi:MAG TPA: indole-3-glycerol-phosphate synthase TrpC, partial [Nitrospiraceae bacterium]|nr:indole-3-glycerol-phosphate synthase TrpC [Nitrospiraceae bacterium]
MNILTEIIDKKAGRLSYAKSAVPIHELKKRLTEMEGARDFRGAITGGGKIKLIAEIKKASPSKGIIRKDFDPAKIAAIYEEKPVGAVSVLTEEDFFQGDLGWIGKIREISNIPILRKDFIYSPFQVYETRA